MSDKRMEKGLLGAVKAGLLIAVVILLMLVSFAFPPLLGIALPIGFIWAVAKLLNGIMSSGGGDDD